MCVCVCLFVVIVCLQSDPQSDPQSDWLIDWFSKVENSEAKPPFVFSIFWIKKLGGCSSPDVFIFLLTGGSLFSRTFWDLTFFSFVLLFLKKQTNNSTQFISLFFLLLRLFPCCTYKRHDYNIIYYMRFEWILGETKTICTLASHRNDTTNSIIIRAEILTDLN